jgi:gas vesicle protein GvpL/GvpF
MAARSDTARDSGSRPQKAVYVYGILPGDVEVADRTRGVGDPPGQVRLVRWQDLAALVSEVDLSKPLGRPDDLRSHAELLDASAAEVPILPLRFGAVVDSEDSVAHELLETHCDEFTKALRDLEGLAQYVVRGRYVEDAILREVLSEDPQAASLNDQIRGADPDATRDARIQLGEMINNAIDAKRQQDTRALGEAMEGLVVASAVRSPSHELDAVHVAFLVEVDGEEKMEQAVRKLAQDWDGRIGLRLSGPMAAYDFVGAPIPES